ncbi:hypothetical protein AHF37_08140 [Paragonimus kellicotti]|nr:hypothetical protein AHF37_08140 [Paragonimus kellicotti]
MLVTTSTVIHHWPTSIACDEPLSPAFSAFDPDVSSVCRRTCVHLGDLSESVEEEKDYETPETMTEEATSLSDSSWQPLVDVNEQNVNWVKCCQRSSRYHHSGASYKQTDVNFICMDCKTIEHPTLGVQ